MSGGTTPGALLGIVEALSTRKRAFALVGGLAVSVRAEPRFTRDVDIAVTVSDDADAESLVRDLAAAGYRAVATVEHETQKRLATARLLSAEGVTVDLLFASSGIEHEIVARASEVELPDAGKVRVAMPEDLLAMKVLSMREGRLQDRLDAQRLLQFAPGAGLDLDLVRGSLALITSRGFHRGQDLQAKLQTVVEDAKRG
jgi:hypothetical protein